MSSSVMRDLLSRVDPEWAALDITESLDEQTLLLMLAFMLGWHPLDTPPAALRSQFFLAELNIFVHFSFHTFHSQTCPGQIL